MEGDRWREATLGEIAKQDYGLVDGPFGSNLPAADYTRSGIPVIRGSNLSLGDSRFKDAEFVFVSEETANRHSRSLCGPLDIVFTKKGTLGQVGIIPERHRYSRFLLSSNQMKLSVNNSVADPKFVYYYVASPRSREKLIRDSEATGVPKTNLEYLRHFPIILPPLNEQQRIGSLLSALDDKIELNRRMNETLEGIGRAIFKSWFIDFDPCCRASKIFEGSELGKIPHGWRVAELGELVEVIDCLHSKKPKRQQNGKPLLQLSNIKDDGLLDMADTYLISEEDYQLWTSRMAARQGDCVITNVGRVAAVAQVPPHIKAALGRNMTGIRCRPQYTCPTFLLELLKSESMKEEIGLKTDSGTILDSLNVRSIPRLRFVLPPPEITQSFEEICRPFRARMELNLEQSCTLAELRDSLLPKLISGKLRVHEAEAAASFI